MLISDGNGSSISAGTVVGVAAATAAAIAVAASPRLLKIVNRIYQGIRLEVRLYYSKKSPATVVGSVAGIFIHPVKSMRAVSLDKSNLDRKGLVDDRRFMVVYELPLPPWKKPGEAWSSDEISHRFLTQRQCPSLATIVATISCDGDKRNEILVLTHDHKSSKSKERIVAIPLSKESTAIKQVFRAGIWDDNVLVEDMGDEVADFLRQIVDDDEECTVSTTSSSVSSNSDTNAPSSIRLVRHSTPDRSVDTTYLPSLAWTWWGSAPLVSLTDGFPILIANERSLDDLNGRLKAANKDEIPMSRFRPNIVIGPAATLNDASKAKRDKISISKTLSPFDEDRWKVIAVGEQVFSVVKACPRCKQSCTDQVTGAVYTEPVETMKSFRQLGDDEKSEDVFFCQNAVPIFRLFGQSDTDCKIHVGDPVRVIEWGDPIFK